MTTSSKEEFTVQPFNSLENHIPTSLMFVVWVLGQPALRTKKVVYVNGRNKEDFSDTMSTFTPLLLSNLDGSPVRLTLEMPELALYKKFALVEVWNADC